MFSSCPAPWAAGVASVSASASPSWSCLHGTTAPDRWRLALRWLVPVAVFALIAWPTSLGVAAAVTLAGWLPCLAGPRRSVYDLLAGVTVIDPVATGRRAEEAKRRAHPWVPPES